MSDYTCRICGGALPFSTEPVVKCEYCGNLLPFPAADSEKKRTLLFRANRLRMACEFDRAAAVYESIAAEFPDEPEASWGIVLCRYGIAYVDDPATDKKIPTCHRPSYSSIWDDPDYQQTMDCADPLARKLYHREAAQIEELREGILAVSASEEPYDIFICYKEIDEHYNRTLDSVLAQDLYDLLTGKGYRVFFSRITLEDKLGLEYEPYIFAALNSAKIMLAVGTCFEHYDAVWVRNEWSRFLKLMEKDQGKHLIPCYKNIDAYDVPKEFRRLQSQDLGKLGAHQDLLRGIEKLLAPKTAAAQPAAQQIVIQQGTFNNADVLVKRGYMALEDEEWSQAETFFNDALNQNAELAEAYWGQFLLDAGCSSTEHFIQEMTSPSQLRSDIIQPISPDTDRIEAAVTQYTVRDFLSEKKIRESYQFDLSVSSQVVPYQEFVSENQAMLAGNKNLNRARQYASSEFRTYLDSVFSQIDSLIQQQDTHHREAEKTAIAEKNEAYQAHLSHTDQENQARYEKALARKEDYQAAKKTAVKILWTSVISISLVLVLIISMYTSYNRKAVSEMRSHLSGKTLATSSDYTGHLFNRYYEYWILTFTDENTAEYYYLHTQGPKHGTQLLNPYGSHPYELTRTIFGNYNLRVNGETFRLKLDSENLPRGIKHSD